MAQISHENTGGGRCPKITNSLSVLFVKPIIQVESKTSAAHPTSPESFKDRSVPLSFHVLQVYHTPPGMKVGSVITLKSYWRMCLLHRTCPQMKQATPRSFRAISNDRGTHFTGQVAKQLNWITVIKGIASQRQSDPFHLEDIFNMSM